MIPRTSLNVTISPARANEAYHILLPAPSKTLSKIYFEYSGNDTPSWMENDRNHSLNPKGEDVGDIDDANRVRRAEAHRKFCVKAGGWFAYYMGLETTPDITNWVIERIPPGLLHVEWFNPNNVYEQYISNTSFRQKGGPPLLLTPEMFGTALARFVKVTGISPRVTRPGTPLSTESTFPALGIALDANDAGYFIRLEDKTEPQKLPSPAPSNKPANNTRQAEDLPMSPAKRRRLSQAPSESGKVELNVTMKSMSSSRESTLVSPEIIEGFKDQENTESGEEAEEDEKEGENELKQGSYGAPKLQWPLIKKHSVAMYHANPNLKYPEINTKNEFSVLVAEVMAAGYVEGAIMTSFGWTINPHRPPVLRLRCKIEPTKWETRKPKNTNCLHSVWLEYVAGEGRICKTSLMHNHLLIEDMDAVLEADGHKRTLTSGPGTPLARQTAFIQSQVTPPAASIPNSPKPTISAPSVSAEAVVDVSAAAAAGGSRKRRRRRGDVEEVKRPLIAFQGTSIQLIRRCMPIEDEEEPFERALQLAYTESVENPLDENIAYPDFNTIITSAIAWAHQQGYVVSPDNYTRRVDTKQIIQFDLICDEHESAGCKWGMVCSQMVDQTTKEVFWRTTESSKDEEGNIFAHSHPPTDTIVPTGPLSETFTFPPEDLIVRSGALVCTKTRQDPFSHLSLERAGLRYIRQAAYNLTKVQNVDLNMILTTKFPSLQSLYIHLLASCDQLGFAITRSGSCAKPTLGGKEIVFSCRLGNPPYGTAANVDASKKKLCMFKILAFALNDGGEARVSSHTHNEHNHPLPIEGFKDLQFYVGGGGTVVEKDDKKREKRRKRKLKIDEDNEWDAADMVELLESGTVGSGEDKTQEDNQDKMEVEVGQ